MQCISTIINIPLHTKNISNELCMMLTKMQKSWRAGWRRHDKMRIEGRKLGARGPDRHRHPRGRRHTHRRHGDRRFLIDNGLWKTGYFSGAIARRAGQRRIDGVMADVSCATACTAHQLSVGHVRQSKSVWCRMHYQHAAAVHNKSVRRGWLAARSTLRDCQTLAYSAGWAERENRKENGTFTTREEKQWFYKTLRVQLLLIVFGFSNRFPLELRFGIPVANWAAFIASCRHSTAALMSNEYH